MLVLLTMTRCFWFVGNPFDDIINSVSQMTGIHCFYVLKSNKTDEAEMKDTPPHAPGRVTWPAS